uniref:Palmitoyltransferase n=1 Tax=Cairina moschata TaxID=8855 RepID=A0A8C3GNS7_CAIMO
MAAAAAARCGRDPCGALCPLLAYLSVGYADYAVLAHVLHGPALRGSPWCPFHAVTFNLIVLLLLACHTRAVFADPGTVPLPGTAIDFSDLRSAAPRKTEQSPEEWTVCSRCEAYRPPRAHHCRVCHRCVRRMDHHCPWINNCVGELNQKYFIQFLFYAGKRGHGGGVGASRGGLSPPAPGSGSLLCARSGQRLRRGAGAGRVAGASGRRRSRKQSPDVSGGWGAGGGPRARGGAAGGTPELWGAAGAWIQGCGGLWGDPGLQRAGGGDPRDVGGPRAVGGCRGGMPGLWGGPRRRQPSAPRCPPQRPLHRAAAGVPPLRRLRHRRLLRPGQRGPGGFRGAVGAAVTVTSLCVSPPHPVPGRVHHHGRAGAGAAPRAGAEGGEAAAGVSRQAGAAAGGVRQRLRPRLALPLQLRDPGRPRVRPPARLRRLSPPPKPMGGSSTPSLATSRIAGGDSGTGAPRGGAVRAPRGARRCGAPGGDFFLGGGGWHLIKSLSMEVLVQEMGAGRAGGRQRSPAPPPRTTKPASELHKYL